MKKASKKKKIQKRKVKRVKQDVILERLATIRVSGLSFQLKIFFVNDVAVYDRDALLALTQDARKSAESQIIETINQVFGDNSYAIKSN